MYLLQMTKNRGHAHQNVHALKERKTTDVVFNALTATRSS